jgi:hypothetical protein
VHSPLVDGQGGEAADRLVLFGKSVIGWVLSLAGGKSRAAGSNSRPRRLQHGRSRRIRQVPGNRPAISGAVCYLCHMARPPKPDDPQAQAAALGILERILLFCVASHTEWERAGITGSTVTATVVQGLIARDPAGTLRLTKQGRAVFAALLGEEDE